MGLLPSNATALENALADIVADLIGDAPVPIRELRQAAACPVDRLPWLAWERDVPFWDDAWPVGLKRAVIAAAAALHREKGTVAADRRILADAGAVYDYAEGVGNDHHTVEIKIRNSESLTVGTSALALAIARVKRASVHYTITAEAGFSAAVPVAAGFGAAAVAVFQARYE